MRTLARSARKTRDRDGVFLPDVLRPLGDAGMKVRLGTTTFLAGPPGAMKTLMALYLVLRWNLPTLYLSADAEDFEVIERAAAMMSGDTINQVRANPEKHAGLLESVSNVKFIFEDSPTYEAVEEELAAYVEILGTAPQVIVIDNLMNLVGENENEWASMRDSARFIHRIARITGAAILVLHHMADDRTDPSTPAPRSKLQGKVGQLPKAIWSLAVAGDELRVSPVKNRWGRGDPSGQTYATLWVDASRARLHNSRNEYLNGVPA